MVLRRYPQPGAWFSEPGGPVGDRRLRFDALLALSKSGSYGRFRLRLNFDRFELVVFAVLVAVSMWVVTLDLHQAALHGLVWTGIDGEFPVDQMQYLAWVRDASQHLLVSDLFVPRATPHDYLQPMVAISGGLTALGITPWLALLAWKPVALAAVFLAVRSYCGRMLAGRWERRTALVLGLFAASYGVLGDEWIPFLSWGYLYGLVAVAALVGALLAYDRARSAGQRPWLAPMLGLLATWLHPWQGELLIVIVVGVELADLSGSLERGLRSGIVLPIGTVGATALPLLYYALLARTDPAWRLAGAVTQHHSWPLAEILLPLAPLLAAAALAYRRRPAGFLGLATRAWPLAALAVYAVSETRLGATPLHAWDGITIPLGVLAVEGVQSLGFVRVPGHRLLAVLAVLALTVPGSLSMMSGAGAYIGPATHNQNLITASELRALRYLVRDPQPGGVLSSYYLGDAVPGETGRRTYSGDYRWSEPGYPAREDAAWRLLHGQLSGRAARAFVDATGVRFVLTDCSSRVDLARALAPIVGSTHRFGCAAVYEIRA